MFNMAEYITMKAIGKRLGYRSHVTVYKLIIEQGLPAYMKYNPPKWCIDDELINQWQLQRAKLHRQQLIDRRERTRKAKEILKREKAS